MVGDAEAVLTVNEPVRATERGFALVLCLMVVLLVTSALGALATAIALQSQAVQREVRALRTRALADAALAETLAGLAKQPTFRGVTRHQLDSGWISSRVKRVGRIASVTLLIELANRETVVEATVELRSRRPRVLAWGVGGLQPTHDVR